MMLLLRNFAQRFFSIRAHLFFLFFIEITMRIWQNFLFHEQECCPVFSNFSFRNSSIVCHFDIFMNKLCFFSDIYFIKDDQPGGSFIFNINQNSTISGLRHRNDLKTINLSSVKNHTKMFMNVILVNSFQSLQSVLISFLLPKHREPPKGTSFQHSSDYLSEENGNNLLNSNTMVFHEPIYLIRRFKCDNIMHVIHDDLLPLFVTYDRLCPGDIDRCISHYRLMFLDDCDSSQFFELYKMFSFNEPLFLHKIKQSSLKSSIQSNEVYFFKNLRVGMDTSSVWFDYGFSHQQGRVAESKIDSVILHKFCNFIIQKLKIENYHLNSEFNILILNRKINRKIINASELKEKIRLISSEVFQKDVTVFESDLYENSVRNLIVQILNAEVIIGMHSSSMILTIFRLTKSKTFIFELFPFGIQPKFVSFLYPLREIVGHRIIYKYWINQRENNSLMYPNNPKMYGGLQHLSVSEREKVLDTKIIPPVRCCHDPAYLFRMYQDTLIDETFIKLYQLSVENFDTGFKRKDDSIYWFFPAPVHHIKCFFEDSLVFISWSVPKNTLLMIKYKVALSAGTAKPLAFIVHENQLVLNLSYYEIYQRPVELSIWIKSFVQDTVDVESVDVFYSCAEQNPKTSATS